MSKRGRPPYPDILTPREWEVLEFLRHGLTNSEIAERLGISLDRAKYHVSEIISKLAVSSREEAARWQPTARPWWAVAFAPVALLWRKARMAVPVRLNSVALAASAGLLAVALGGLGLMVVLLLRGGEREGLPTGQALADRVARAVEQAESFRVEFPGLSGNGDEPSDWTIDFIRPDRWRQTVVYADEEDCPQESVIIELTEYNRSVCGDQLWHLSGLEPAQFREEQESFLNSTLWPPNLLVPTLEALIDPETRLETPADGREVLVVSGTLDYARFIAHFPMQDSDVSQDPTETLPNVRAEVRLLADSYLPLELVFDVSGEETTVYRFSAWNAIPPIEAPSPVAPTATPFQRLLPTPVLPLATPARTLP